MKSYSFGCSGDQSTGEVTGTVISAFVLPSCRVPPNTTAHGASEADCTSMRTHDAATSGVIRSADIYASGTYSIHTVCHMPLWGVYHMPPRFVRCLPRVYSFVSVASFTRTVRIFSPSEIKSVMSTSKAAYPPRCEATDELFM